MPNSNTSKTFALVLALHVALLWLAQAVWTSEPARAVREVVAAQLIQEFRAPELPKFEPPKPNVPKPPIVQTPLPQIQSQVQVQTQPALPPAPALPTQPAMPASPATSTLPAITAPSPSAAVPVAASPQPATAVAPTRSPVVTAPTKIETSCDKPRYPPISFRLQEEGAVKLRFLISENGQVMSGAVEKSSGYKRLDDAALAALSLCKFRPATADGKPKQDWTTLTYRWEFND